ncbi:MAG TPA: hypothetical protein VI299_17680 [Polyangiales bacterium]
MAPVRVWVMVLLASWSLAMVARAEPQGRAAWFLAQESRTLAQHTYIPPLLQQSAFVTSHFGVRQGFSSLVVPNVATDLGRQDLRANGFTQSFDLGLKLFEFIGLYATAFGTVNSGTNAASAFDLGANLEAGFRAGGVLRLLRLPQVGTQLSLRVSGGLGSVNEINVDQFLEAAQQDTAQLPAIRRDSALALLVTPARAVLFGTSVHWAQTIVPALALQTSVAFGRSNTTSRPFDLGDGRRAEVTRDERIVETSFALSLDLASFRVPVALMPEYQLVREAVSARDGALRRDFHYRSQRVGGGIYYSGRPNLVLGVGAFTALNLEQDRLEWNAADGSRKRSGAPSQTQAHFVLRYVW